MSSKGKCNLTYLVLRAEPSGKSEMVSQVIYGESYKVLEKSEDWLYIENEFDGYRGWISGAQHVERAGEEAATTIYNKVSGRRGNHWVSCGSEVAWDGHQEEESDLIRLAHDFLNTPYLWGGRTFMGIDCSGFIQVLFKTRGMSLPRDARDQVFKGESVLFEDRRSLDVAFFANQQDQVVHTGLLLDPHLIVHAHGWVRIDSLDVNGIWNADKDKYTHRLHSIRRFL